MPVATPLQPDYTSQTGTAYPLAIDASIAAAKRLAWAFAPHEQSTPNMTVRLEAGYVLSSALALAEVAAQSTGTITAPTTNPRIDRIVIDRLTGAVSVITGTQAASPVPPAITTGKRPVAQVLLQTSSTVITNGMITDERVQSTPTPLTAAEIGAVGLTGDETIAGAKTFSSDTNISKAAPAFNLLSTGGNQSAFQIFRDGNKKWAALNEGNVADDLIIQRGGTTEAYRVAQATGNATFAAGMTLTGLLQVLGGQIEFPATQNPSAGANTLDDYEEGTWTPSLGGSATYTTQSGKYRKVGALMFIRGRIGINVLGTGSTNVISGVPFAASDDTPCAISESSSLATAVVSLNGSITSTSISMYSRTAAATSDTLANNIFGNGATLNVAGCYPV